MFSTAFTRPIYFPRLMHCSHIYYMCCRRRRLYCARINSRRTRRLTLHRISPCIETLYTYTRYILCMCVRLIDISGGRQRTCNWISKISSPLHHFNCSRSLSLSHPIMAHISTPPLLYRGRLTIYSYTAAMQYTKKRFGLALLYSSSFHPPETVAAIYVSRVRYNMSHVSSSLHMYFCIIWYNMGCLNCTLYSRECFGPNISIFDLFYSYFVIL